VVASLIETAKLAGVEPRAYLADVIARIVSTGGEARDQGRPHSQRLKGPAGQAPAQGS
jgi:hypothetical protein